MKIFFTVLAVLAAGLLPTVLRRALHKNPNGFHGWNH